MLKQEPAVGIRAMPPGKGAFYNTSLRRLLKEKNVESLILTGVTTHVCVHSTLREAIDRGFECLVLEDGTAAYDPADHTAALRMVHQQGGIFGCVASSDALLKALHNASSANGDKMTAREAMK